MKIEWKETLHKGRAVFQTVAIAERGLYRASGEPRKARPHSPLSHSADPDAALARTVASRSCRSPWYP